MLALTWSLTCLAFAAGGNAGDELPEERARFHSRAVVAMLVIAVVCMAIAFQGRPARAAGPPQKQPHGIGNLDSRLNQAVQRSERQGPASARDLGAGTRVATDGSTVEVEIDAPPGRQGGLASVIRRHGGTVRGSYLDLLDARVPLSALAGIAAESGDAYIHAPTEYFADVAVSEAVVSTNAQAWQTAGLTGSGVKIAVIDGGFAGLAARQLAGDLPPGMPQVDYCDGAFATATQHGTAVAELIHKMAPSAQLLLVCTTGTVSLGLAKDYAKAQGVDIINFSRGSTAGRGDGTSVSERIVADARASGILWVNAAGNYGRKHWSGVFRDDGNGFNVFENGNDRNGLRIATGATSCVTMKWDSWPTTSLDYDLYLVRDADSAVVAGSVGTQTGTQPPLEELCYTNASANEYHSLYIAHHSGTGSPRIDVSIDLSGILQLSNPAGSITLPATSPASFSVGAMCWQARTIAAYSSQGPTIDGRTKPDIAGPSSVSTGTYGAFTGCDDGSGFPGTSSAAPNVAGAAALVKQANPSFTATQLETFLESRALDLGPPGKDDVFGFGALALGTAPVAAPQPCIAPLGGTPTMTNYLPNITKFFGGITGFQTPFIVQNTGSAATNLEVTFYRFSDGSCVTRRTVGALAPGRSFADVPNNDTDLPGNTQFSVVVRSFGSSIVSVVNEHQGTGERAEALSYDGFSQGSTGVSLPNIVRRFYGYHTPFIMQNLGTATTTVTARFVSFDGSVPQVFAGRTIAPGQSKFVEPNSDDAALGAPGLVNGKQYAVTLTSDQPIAVVVNTHLDDPSIDHPVAYATDGVVGGAATLYGPYAAKNAQGIGRISTVVVQNTGATAVTPSLSFRALGGAGAQQTFVSTSAIAPGASWAFDPRFIGGAASPDPGTLCGPAASAVCLGDGEYSFVASASGPIAAAVNVISPLTAMGYTASASPAAKYFLPNVTRTLGGPAGWTTPILLQSASAAGAQLQWYRFSDGALILTQTVAIPAGTGVRIDPLAQSALSDDTQYAVVVTGTGGTVAAIVVELAQGGDNAMIYEGFAAP
ncbi:MAG: S8 family serine peptidase [Candidatus Limnocylindria bacterium]